jgi:hypothetical protein
MRDRHGTSSAGKKSPDIILAQSTIENSAICSVTLTSKSIIHKEMRKDLFPHSEGINNRGGSRATVDLEPVAVVFSGTAM